MVTGRPSGPVSVFSHGRNALWEHTMASSCGEIRLAVILRTNLPMTPESCSHPFRGVNPTAHVDSGGRADQCDPRPRAFESCSGRWPAPGRRDRCSGCSRGSDPCAASRRVPARPASSCAPPSCRSCHLASFPLAVDIAPSPPTRDPRPRRILARDPHQPSLPRWRGIRHRSGSRSSSRILSSFSTAPSRNASALPDW